MTLRARLTDLADRIPLPAETLGGVVVGAVVQRMRPCRYRPRSGRPAPSAPSRGSAWWRWPGANGGRATWSTRSHSSPPACTARTRNPIYVGFTLAHLGLAAATHNGWMLATCPVSAVLVHRWVPREERLLHELFGAEYDAYRATVPRYL